MKRLLLSLILASAACGGTTTTATPPAASPPAAAAPVVAPGEAKVGDRTRCPVSGEEFVVKADSPHVEVAGKTYYTCCPHCAEKLKADPQRYLSKPGA